MRYYPIGARKFWQQYWYIKVGEGDWRLEHRIVMEQALGRPLETDEHVHHINEIKTDNRPENLEVLTREGHVAEHNRRRSLLTPPEVMCVECGKTVERYRRKRLCWACYAKRKRRANPARTQEAYARYHRVHPGRAAAQARARLARETPDRRAARLAYMRAYYIRNRANPSPRLARLPAGQWSRNHAACVSCGLTRRPHQAKGLCIPCYARSVTARKHGIPEVTRGQ